MVGRCVAIIGAGAVGSAVAAAIAEDAVADAVTLVDTDEGRAHGEAMDLEDALALAAPVQVGAGGYEEAARADLVILTAGKTGGKEQDRMALLQASGAIVRDAVGRLRAEGFGGVLLVVSNPADVMAELALRVSGLDAERVLGSGTLLDSMRLRRLLGRHLGVAPELVAANVIGEHGDTSVSVLSSATVGGVPLAAFGPPPRVEVQEQVRARARRITEGKGNTSRGIGAACARIVRAILRDERAVLPLAARRVDEDLFFGTPCVVGARGIERTLSASLDAGESEDAARSLAVLREAVAKL